MMRRKALRLIISTYQFHYKDAELIEKPDGQRDDEKGEDVGGGRDDGCDDEDGYDGMSAIARHEG